MNHDKHFRQPLGGAQELNRIIQSAAQYQIEQDTSRIVIIYAKSKLEVDIPTDWSVNKLKCMLITHFQMLNFDKFEFQCNKFLIPGKTLVRNLPSRELIVTQAQCPQTFQKLYIETMTKISKKYRINSESTLYPILHQSFSNKMVCSIERQNNFEQIPAHRLRRRLNQEQGVRVINIIRAVGIVAMSNLLFSLASFSQIAILVGIALVYLLMDHYVNQNQRRRRQLQRQQRQAQQQQERLRRQGPDLGQANPLPRYQIPVNYGQNQNNLNQQKQKVSHKEQRRDEHQNEDYNEDQNDDQSEDQNQDQNGGKYQETDQAMEQAIIQRKVTQQELEPLQNVDQGQKNPLKAKMIIWLAFTVQALYCYFLSVFPNWTVQTHLHANQQKMDHIMDKVKQLDPEASQMIKNWKKQEQKQHNQ